MLKHSSIASRLLALSILMVLITLPIFGIVLPLREKTTRLEGEIARQQEALADYRKWSNSRKTLEVALTKLRKRSSHRESYIDAPTRSLAEAKLQQTIKGSIAQNGGQLVSVQIIPARGNEIPRPVTLRAQVNISMKGLRRVLYGLEGGTPFLFIDNLSIRPELSAQGTARRENQSGEAAKQLVHIQYDVSGYLQEVSAK